MEPEDGDNGFTLIFCSLSFSNGYVAEGLNADIPEIKASKELLILSLLTC